MALPTPFTIALCVTSTVCTVYSFRNLRAHHQHRSQLRQIAHLLNRIDAFDNALRQKIKYFREVQCLAAPQRQVLMDAEINATIATALPVIWAIYDAIQRLESLPLARAIATVYVPSESLELCDLLAPMPDGSQRQYGVHSIRDTQDIFQFLQSQLLLRLGLATVYSVTEASTFVGHDVPLLCARIDAQLRLLADEETARMQCHELRGRLVTTRLAQRQHIDGDAMTLTNLRHVTADILGSMLALTAELRGVNAVLGRATNVRDAEMLAVEADVQRIGERLDVCRDEFARMVCTYNRAVHGRVELSATDSLSGAADVGDAEPAPAVRLFDDNDAMIFPDAEFYALAERNDDESSDDDTSAVAQDSRSLDAELAELNAKIVKRQFRPVLRQLRDRLEPINDAMRQRERMFFEERGIQLTEHDRRLGSDDDQSEDDDENDKKAKVGRKDNYADRRQFMLDNQSMGFMPLLQGLPMQHRGTMDEVILE